MSFNATNISQAKYITIVVVSFCKQHLNKMAAWVCRRYVDVLYGENMEITYIYKTRFQLD